MIINFKIKNYRSIKDETLFSLEASGAKGKSDNVAEITVKNGKKFRLLKTAVIYGANASGKSNVIRAFWAFRQLIDRSFRYDVNDNIELAEPFELDVETADQPTEFTLNFIGWDKVQYIYCMAIYKRTGRKITSINRDFFKNKNSFDKINPKRLFLSELGNSGEEYWENMRNYFIHGNMVLNAAANGMLIGLAENAKSLFESDIEGMEDIKNKVVKLVQLSDLGIKGLELVEEEEFFKPGVNKESYSGSRINKRFKTTHNVYKDHKIFKQHQFDLLNQASTGTIALVGLCTEIMLSLNFTGGRPIWIDEVDNSMHPYLCRFLISLFHHPRSNPYNSQLIFATHETTLLDKNNFRKDQIWITSKDKYGCTKLYSVYDLDIEGLRDDIPFDKWYMSGKFGGLPNIKTMDFIFDRDNKLEYEKEK
jgi:AAA15 family ATPase/GTPase